MAAVRRNSRLAWLKEREAADTASQTAQSAWAGLTESMIDTWSESQLKEFCDKNGITGTSCPLEPAWLPSPPPNLCTHCRPTTSVLTAEYSPPGHQAR